MDKVPVEQFTTNRSVKRSQDATLFKKHCRSGPSTPGNTDKPTRLLHSSTDSLSSKILISYGAIFSREEECMTTEQKARMIKLQRRAEQHANEYKRLFQDRRTRAKALIHLRKAERLYSLVRDLIMAHTPVTVRSRTENDPIFH